MDNTMEHYRHSPLSHFRKGKNVVQVRKKLCEFYGDDCLYERQCQCGLPRFRSGNFDV